MIIAVTGPRSIVLNEIFETYELDELDTFKEYAFELADLIHQREHPGSELFSYTEGPIFEALGGL